MRLLSIIYLLCLSLLSISAQPFASKKVKKSVFKLTTFKSDGSLNATGYGAFVDNEGTALCAWTPFEGAASAVIIDAQGKKYNVLSIDGANNIYNVAKIKAEVSGTPDYLPAIIETTPQQGGDVWCAKYDVKNLTFEKHAIARVETFMTDMPYYVIEQQEKSLGDEMIGAPFFNSKGELMGLMNTSTTRTDLYIASARFAITFETSGFSANDYTLRQTDIRASLPKEYNNAILALLIAERRYSKDNYLALTNDFLKAFPDKEDGYVTMVQILTNDKKFKEAEDFFNEAITKVGNTASLHYSFFKIIYTKEKTMADAPYAEWSLTKALAELDKAIELSPETQLYQQQREALVNEMNAPAADPETTEPATEQ